LVVPAFHVSLPTFLTSIHASTDWPTPSIIGVLSAAGNDCATNAPENFGSDTTICAGI